MELENMTDDEIRAELENALKWIEIAKKGGYEYDMDEHFVFVVKTVRPDIYKEVVR